MMLQDIIDWKSPLPWIIIVIGIIAALIILGTFLKAIVVVPFNEVHVVSRGKKVTQYDGSGRYFYFKAFYGRTIIPKHVLDVEPALIKLHDIDKLPFGVEISVKVQVTDPPKAAATLTQIDHSTISKVVEDTVMSAARSVAMERNILDIMKQREEIEKAIYIQVSDALSKLGLSPVIFDIKNITDIEGSDVIASLEKVKIAELRRNARISEATSNSDAIKVETEKAKDNAVKVEQMKKEEELARFDREKTSSEQKLVIEEKRLRVEQQNTEKLAEIDRNKKIMLAKAEGEAVSIKAQADSNAVKLRLEAEAEGIRLRGVAEADAIKQKAEAMKLFNETSAQIKILELITKAQVDAGEQIAKAIGTNNKIIYLPSGGSNGDGNFLANFLPKIDSLLQSGLLQGGLADLLTKLKAAGKAASDVASDK
nr:SPFH domain-containing protein [Candidatus Sigynarchaeota archaeon]